jgi:formylglycine-generating enzyme required for sulfatase activity
VNECGGKDDPMKAGQTFWMLGTAAGLALAAQGADLPRNWVDTEAGSPTGTYLVIDLTPRRLKAETQDDPRMPVRTEEGFVVSNLADVPPGGWTEEYKSTKLVLRRIPAGTFQMGSPAGELGRDADETQHAVTLTKDYYIGVFEVTMKQWERVTGRNAGEKHFKHNLSVRGDAAKQSKPSELHCRPVETITFYGIRENPRTDLETARALVAKQAPPPESRAKEPGKKQGPGKTAGAPEETVFDEADDPAAAAEKAREEEQKEKMRAKSDAASALKQAMEQPSHDPNVDWPAKDTVNADSFFGKLRAMTRLSGLDLPTEAQWEYACRAGTTTALNSGKDLTQRVNCPNLAEVGRFTFNVDPSDWWWYKSWERLGSAVVGSYAPNKWGLYDMHGNVWEWCLYWYGPYPAGAVTDPKGPPSGDVHVIRGGCWEEGARACRSANRGTGGIAAEATPYFGFRVALRIP